MNPDPRNPEHRELVERAAADLRCPNCGHVGFTVEWTLAARPIGSFSLSGQQMKFSATEALIVTCPECGTRGVQDQ